MSTDTATTADRATVSLAPVLDLQAAEPLATIKDLDAAVQASACRF